MLNVDEEKSVFLSHAVALVESALHMLYDELGSMQAQCLFSFPLV